MAGLFGLSVNPHSFKDDFGDKLFWGTSYGQHMSGEFSGLAVFDGQKIITDSRPGLFAHNFKERMGGFLGTEAIGYCGPAEEPFHVKKSKVGKFSICFCGNLINCAELVDEFMHEGHTFERGDDIEVMTKLIVQGKDFVEGIRWMAKRIKGAFALLVLTSEGIYAVRSPDGCWPLVIGSNTDEGAVIVASECVGFNNLGFKRVRDLEAGEIILLKDGGWQQKDTLPKTEVQECSFYGVYTSAPSAIVHESPATFIRKRLGASLARQDIANNFIPHIVTGVPDSGRFHGHGYYEEFINEVNRGNFKKIKRVPYYREDLLKYGIVRSYLAPTQQQREEKAHYKIVITNETIEHFLQMLEKAGLIEIIEDIKKNRRIIIVICDDSIVRGSQIASNLAPKVRLIFEKKIDDIDIKAEIHLRISYPELRSHCPWGKTTKKGETLAERVPKKEDRIKELGVDGLEYNSVEDLVEILRRPKENLCIDCCLHRE